MHVESGSNTSARMLAQQNDREEHVPIAVVTALKQQGDAQHAGSINRTAGSQQKTAVGEMPFPHAHVQDFHKPAHGGIGEEKGSTAASTLTVDYDASPVLEITPDSGRRIAARERAGGSGV